MEKTKTLVLVLALLGCGPGNPTICPPEDQPFLVRDGELVYGRTSCNRGTVDAPQHVTMATCLTACPGYRDGCVFGGWAACDDSHRWTCAADFDPAGVPNADTILILTPACVCQQMRCPP